MISVIYNKKKYDHFFRQALHLREALKDSSINNPMNYYCRLLISLCYKFIKCQPLKYFWWRMKDFFLLCPIACSDGYHVSVGNWTDYLLFPYHAVLTINSAK